MIAALVDMLLVLTVQYHRPGYNNITRTLADATLLQWGQIKTRKLYLSIYLSICHPYRSVKIDEHLLLITFAPDECTKCASK